MEFHQKRLQRICRSCGKVNSNFDVHPKYRVPVTNATYKPLLLSLSGINVDNESSDIFPKWICLSCKGKLDRRKKHSRNKSKKANNITLPTPPTFSPHTENDCCVCEVENVEAEASSPKVDDSRRPEFAASSTTPLSNLGNSRPSAPTVGPSVLEVAITASVTFGYQMLPVLSNGHDGGYLFLKTDGTNLIKRLYISPHGEWQLFVYNVPVTPHSSPEVLGWVQQRLTSHIMMDFFHCIERSRLCVGNEYNDLCRVRSPNGMASFRNSHNNIVAKEEVRAPFEKPSIRHNNCSWIIKDTNANKTPLCSECFKYRNTLKTLNQRIKGERDHRTEATSKVNFACLSEAEKLTRLQNVAADRKQLQRRVAALEAKIVQEMDTNSTKLDSEADRIVNATFKDQARSVLQDLPEDNPSRILWEQQQKYLELKDARSMRWHPLIVRWCVALQTKSSSAYNAIRTSGFLTLPHPRTLAKYSNFTTPEAGFNPAVLKQIYESYNLETVPKEQRFVALLFDEIKIKSGLAFSKRSGRMVGICDVGEIQNEVADFERRINGEKTTDELGSNLATHILVLMARSICGRLHIPIAYFPTRSATSGDIYETVWKGVQILEGLGMEVRAFVSDGASPNRKFYRMMNTSEQDSANKLPGYYTKNLSCPSRNIYFICDVPHLIKTTRNNWENSGCGRKSRKLIYIKQEITLQQLINLKEWDIRKGGIHKLPKLTFDHLRLNPTTRMRVYLAAQVLSSSVAKAFKSQNRHDTKSTTKFVSFFDKFLDCLNVSNTKEGITSLTPDLLPYRSTDDIRFKWLGESFLGFLTEWEGEAPQAPAKERKQYCLSRETLEGLRITVQSFIRLVPELLQEGASYVLSEKLTQDPLEEHFSKQRSCAGANTNPSMLQYGDNETKIIYAATNSHIMTSEYGNCRNKKRRSEELQNPAKKILVDS